MAKILNWSDIVVNYLLLQIIKVLSLEGVFEANQFVENNSHSPDVTLRAVLSLRRKKFRRKVKGGAYLSRRCKFEVLVLALFICDYLIVLILLSQSKVSEF